MLSERLYHGKVRRGQPPVFGKERVRNDEAFGDRQPFPHHEGQAFSLATRAWDAIRIPQIGDLLRERGALVED